MADDEFDALFSQLDCDKCIAELNDPKQDSTTSESLPLQPSVNKTSRTSSQPNRFSTFVSDQELQEAKKCAVPKNTDKCTNWALNIWKEWSTHRQKQFSSHSQWPTHLMITQPIELDYWLSKFMLEARKANGDCYTPDTLYSICSGLLRYIRENRPEINIFKSSSFAGFQRTLDGEMKRLRSTGLGVKRKQAEPITIEEENLLWEKGLLGDTTPQVLLDTILFLCGIHYALRSGDEHRSLQISQLELISPSEGPARLVYTENSSKNNPGGLLHRKIQPKQVTCYENSENPSRCLVKLFQKYVSHCPSEPTCFYLTPVRKIKNNIWYSKTPVGHNTLAGTVSRICKKAGVSGYKTNHSLRVTSATRLFQNGIDEQLIMSNTGHRSVDGVRCYKRIGEEQKKHMSSVLNSTTNGEQSNEPPECNPSNPKKPKLTTVPTMNTKSLSIQNSSAFNLCSTHPPVFNIEQ